MCFQWGFDWHAYYILITAVVHMEVWTRRVLYHHQRLTLRVEGPFDCFRLLALLPCAQCRCISAIECCTSGALDTHSLSGGELKQDGGIGSIYGGVKTMVPMGGDGDKGVGAGVWELSLIHI